jgi:ketosteroid isomerase-like protein
LLLLASGALFAQPPGVAVPKTAPAPTLWPTGNAQPGAADLATMNEVIAFERKMEAAVVRGDVRTLEPMLADSFIFTHGDGWATGGAPLKTDTKASWLAYVAQQPTPYLYRELDHVQVELHGDIALTLGRYLYLPRPADGKPTTSHRYVWFERVYQKQNGQWRHVSHKTVKGPVREDDEPAGAGANQVSR